MHSNINRLARRLACFAFVTATTLIALPARADTIDLFNQLVTGARHDFSGTVGFAFTADSSFTISELGRAVNPAAGLAASHLVQLWDATSDTELGEVTVGPASPLDALGYAIAPLTTPIHINSGGHYALTTLETNGGPDLWGDQTDLTGKYDTSLITVDHAAFHAGGGFPSNAANAGDGYGVPTFIAVVAPEPSSLILAGLSAIGLLFAVRRRLRSGDPCLAAN